MVADRLQRSRCSVGIMVHYEQTYPVAGLKSVICGSRAVYALHRSAYLYRHGVGRRRVDFAFISVVFT